MGFKYILSIETSCDDTSVAIIDGEGFVQSVCMANQDIVHAPFGGIVPELASRNHTQFILPLIEKALEKSHVTWESIQGIAVTNRPGLIGSLMVGLIAGKTLALSKNLPLVGINHIEGHIVAPLLKDSTYAPPKDFAFPYLALIVSGGHTQLVVVKTFGNYEIIGRTRDDASGEAFDKFAKLVGLGYPGGVLVDQLASKGQRDKFSFPRGMFHEKNLDFSFSGLKAAAQRLLTQFEQPLNLSLKQDLCASYQEAIVDVLIKKIDSAVTLTGINKIAITGGVSANSRLREQALVLAQTKGLQVIYPPLRFCTDNAAMIGLAGLWRLNRGERSSLSLGVFSRSLPEDFTEAPLCQN
ncbi:MAG: tRNA (adenosine(37)-N6)-threonylcarbamoyltransferase complex transferase subunit TsaD [Bdellovibrionales bacterium]|nr:tRNA (adenosine(37)-N6)-threonylcarbamoyltransferase complex transferase subunit TsaD [Bdellovibrionales bacterium]